MGIKEKQAEMKEMDASLSTKRTELMELEKTIRQRQKLLDLTSREIKDGILKLEQEKKVVEEKKAQAELAEEPANCTATTGEPEGLTMKRGEVPGLQVMGILTLCSLLATLGWRGGG
jgi:chromosome segregation ATPase